MEKEQWTQMLVYNSKFFCKLLFHYNHHIFNNLLKIILCLNQIITLSLEKFVSFAYLLILFNSIEMSPTSARASPTMVLSVFTV